MFLFKTLRASFISAALLGAAGNAYAETVKYPPGYHRDIWTIVGDDGKSENTLPHCLSDRELSLRECTVYRQNGAFHLYIGTEFVKQYSSKNSAEKAIRMLEEAELCGLPPHMGFSSSAKVVFLLPGEIKDVKYLDKSGVQNLRLECTGLEAMTPYYSIVKGVHRPFDISINGTGDSRWSFQTLKAAIQAVKKFRSGKVPKKQLNGQDHPKEFYPSSQNQNEPRACHILAGQDGQIDLFIGKTFLAHNSGLKQSLRRIHALRKSNLCQRTSKMSQYYGD
jgi:hypothetical protein